MALLCCAIAKESKKIQKSRYELESSQWQLQGVGAHRATVVDVIIVISTTAITITITTVALHPKCAYTVEESMSTRVTHMCKL